MNRFVLISFLFLSRFCFCQISNSGFESWTYSQDSFGLSTYIPLDTFSYLKLDNWTSSNSLTGNPNAGGKYLVNQSIDSYSGSYAIRMNTDSIFIAGSLNTGIIVPGFIVNGNFKFDLTSILFQSSGLINPQNLTGAGSPISQRIDKIGLHIKYAPIPGDSLLIWAVLKKGGTEVAQCKLYSSQASPTYSYIEGTFNYYSCNVPDTIVVLIASSNPNFSTLLSGTSGLRPGSVLIADSISLIPFANGMSRPIAGRLNTFVYENHTKRVTLYTSDTDCTGLPLTYSLTGQPSHGTASINGDTVTYTSSTGFSGIDTVFYSVSNGSYSNTGYVVFDVFSNTGIEETQSDRFSLFPNPANNIITISNPDNESGSCTIYNPIGQILIARPLFKDESTIDISSLSAGTYFITIHTAKYKNILKFIKE